MEATTATSASSRFTRIEAAAEAHFENRHIDASVSEQQQRGERVELEVRERRVATRGLDAIERGNQLRIGCFCAVDADPLVVANEVRRSEYASRKARGAQERVRMRNDRALAIGAADGEHRAARLVDPERPRHLRNARQPEINARRM